MFFIKISFLLVINNKYTPLVYSSQVRLFS